MFDSIADGWDAVPPGRGPREPICWSQRTPDAVLADELARARSVPPPTGMHHRDVGFEILERIGAWEKIISWAQAGQHAEITQFMQHNEAHRPVGVDDEQQRRSVAAELGVMLRASQRSADIRLDTALDLVQRLPEVHAALAAGRISLPSARTIAEETVHLPTTEARAVSGAVLTRAGEQTPGQLRAATRRAVLQADPDAVRKRHVQAARERGVWLHEEPDGMASLHARLPADQAVGCYALLDEYARHATSGPTDDRSMDARRADALVDLLWGSAKRVSVQVRVTVPYGTLLGLDQQPGNLAGYGPLPAHLARRLAADGCWQRILTDPVSGAVLDYGTTRYSPPRHLREHVVTRDQSCHHPGCRVPAHRCDLDHIIPFDPITGTGPTSADNLAPTCRTHHQVKQHPGWAVTRSPDGTSTWTTPTGHTYTTRPPPLC